MNGRTIRLLTGLAVVLTTAPAMAQKPEDAAKTIEQFKKGDPGMTAWFAEAHGYAVFPSVGKGGIGVGGAHGKGLVYRQGVLIGKVTLTQVSVGLQLGGQAFSEVIFFKDRTALDDFTRGNYEFSAQVSAVALKEGASANLAYNKGVAVMTATKGGLMYEASVGGQKFSYEAIPEKESKVGQDADDSKAKEDSTGANVDSSGTEGK